MLLAAEKQIEVGHHPVFRLFGLDFNLDIVVSSLVAAVIVVTLFALGARAAKKNADGSAGQVLGVHMVGPWVTEQLSGGYLAVNWEATVEEIAEFIQPHPSLSELFGETVMSLTGRSINA